MPNWLREEIIKNKAAITNSTPEQFKEGIQSMEDVSIDKPIGEGDQVDSKSMDSSRSTEEDDDEVSNSVLSWKLFFIYAKS